jgi:hypothetical protein
MEGGARYDSTHKYWGLAVKAVETDYPKSTPSELCELWDMIDAWDAQEAAHQARQAAGLEPPDDYPMIAEESPPGGDEEVQATAQRLCGLLKYHYDDKWRRLGKLIQATVLGGTALHIGHPLPTLQNGTSGSSSRSSTGGLRSGR